MKIKLLDRGMNGRLGEWTERQEDCSYVWKVVKEQQCQFVQEIKKCESSSTIQYLQLLFCVFGTENISNFIFGCILLILWLLYLFIILGSTSDNFFCPALAVIASVLRLSDTIAGVTILAFGNGAPDVFTSLASSQDSGLIMFTELMGAGVFVTTIIAGSIAIVGPFKVVPQNFMRDASFYILSASWITYVVSDEYVKLWEAISFLLLYLVFIIVVVLMQFYESKKSRRRNRIPMIVDADILESYAKNQNRNDLPKLHSRAITSSTKIDIVIAQELKNYPKLSSQMQDQQQTSSRPKGLFKEFLFDVNPINGEDWRKANLLVKLLLVIRSPVMLVLQFFIPVVNETAEKRGWSKLLNCLQLKFTPTALLACLHYMFDEFVPLLVFGIVESITIVLSIFVFWKTRIDKVPKYHDAFAFMAFITAMLVVYILAQEVMSTLEAIGVASGISEPLLGITFLAWGNSISDLISNIAISKKGFSQMGFSACFGGPMFNTLFGLGLVYGKNAAESPELKIKIRISDMSPGCLVYVLCSLVCSISYFNATGFRARRSYGFLLYSLYASFILICILSEYDVMHPLGVDRRSDETDVQR